MPRCPLACWRSARRTVAQFPQQYAPDAQIAGVTPFCGHYVVALDQGVQRLTRSVEGFTGEVWYPGTRVGTAASRAYRHSETLNNRKGVTIMKRIGLVVGVLVLSVGLVLGQTGVGQMGQRGSGNPAASNDAMSIQMETRLLRAISVAGLSVEQLQQLQTVFASVQSADEALLQRQQELRDFLYGWQGSPDELDSALEPHEQALDQARQAYQDARQSAVAELQTIFTIAQGEALVNAFRGGTGPTAQGAGPMSGHAMGQGPQQMGNRGSMGGMHGQRQNNQGMQRMQQNQAELPDGLKGQGNAQSGAMAQRHAQMMGRMGGQAGQGGGMQANCPMMNQGQMGPQRGTQGAGAGFGPMFLGHLDLWQQVIGEKLNRLQGSSS